jgi:heme-degrading monooxygenase HmoA
LKKQGGKDMINHFVLWNFKDTLAEQEKEECGKKIKKSLEELSGQIDGLVEIKVSLNQLESSDRELVLISTFEHEAALKEYQIHPKHIEISNYVKQNTCDRVCIDYEI